MKCSCRSALLFALVVSALVSAPPVHASVQDDGPAVYLRLVESAPLPYEAVAARLEATLAELGWKVFPPMECGVDEEKCSFRSRILVAHHPTYVDRVMEYGVHAAYAAPVRFTVYEDENGVHVAATNPRNLNRTIVDEETRPEDWDWAAEMIRDVARTAFPDHVSDAEFGQHREKARIGRTFGIMAGGKFVDKIETITTLPIEGTTTALQIAQLLEWQIEELEGDWDWGLRPAYVMDLAEHGIAVLGLTAASVESKAFSIVGHGGDDARKELACPGVDHAAAFPIEVVIAEIDGEIQVSLVDEMYRMKMFFEDAGKMAFAKNMGMPGSIEDEIKKKVTAIIG